jgi:hypothetical protein
VTVEGANTTSHDWAEPQSQYPAALPPAETQPARTVGDVLPGLLTEQQTELLTAILTTLRRLETP